MIDSGEQFIPGKSAQRLKDEHLNRYNFAKNYCIDKDILDIACGTGYGSYGISSVANSVVGVDVSEQAIEFARNNFVRENLAFEKNNCLEIKFEDKFGVVISFETIEHLDKNSRQIFLSLIHKSLKKDGLFIISTPNKRVTSPYTVKPLNQFHIMEFTKNQLEEELSELFEINSWFGQRFLNAIFLVKAIRKSVSLIEKVSKHDFGLYSTRFSPKVTAWKGDSHEPRILIAVCKKKK